MEASLPAERVSQNATSEAELVSQIERALYQLYNDPEGTNKNVADRWLQAIQLSQEAWSLPWLLLQHQSFEVKNFGALMLCNKITRGWSELPPDHYNILRVELFKHLAHFSSGHRLISIQLSRALVGVAFHTMPEQWPNTVVSCIHSLKKACQEVPGSDFASVVVHFLTILPEEFDKISSNTLTIRRGSIKAELTAGLHSVLALMEEVITRSQDTTTKMNAINCCSSWIFLGCPIRELSSLIQLLFSCLHEPDLLGNAAETLCDIVSHDDSFKYPMTLRKFMQRVLEKRDFMRSKLEENDMEICMCLVKLVQGTALSNMNFLLDICEDSPAEDSEDALSMVHLLMEFLCVPGTYPVDERCSESTFPFWENFLDGIASVEPDKSKSLLEFYVSAMTSLIEVFPDKAQYPPDQDWKEVWMDDDKDDFILYRENLCELGECLQMTMQVEYLQHLSSLFSDLLSRPQPPTWQSVEAVLYLLQGVASNITQQSSPTPLIRNVLALFPSMPPHPILVKTALSLLGLLSSWFKHHPSLLQGVLPMILGSLSQADLAPSAALAFRDVCAECSVELTLVASQLIPHCQQGLSNPQLTSRDCVCVVAAIGSVLSRLPLSDLVPPMESLVSSRVEALQALAQEEPTKSNKSLVEKELGILGALCHHIYPVLSDGEQHPVVLLLIQLFPAVQSLISKWCTDPGIVESICIVINRAMRTVDKQYAPLLDQTVELIVKCYAAVHHHKLLDSANQVIEVFGRESSYASLLSALLQPLHSITLQLFQSAMSDHPDVVQAYLRLMTKTLKVCPTVLLSIDGIMSSLFDICLAALKLPEQPTVAAASSFFVAFIGLSTTMGPVSEVLQLNGKVLVQYILQAIAWAAPRSYVVSFSDIINSLLVNCITLLSQWLEELLAQDGFPSNHLTPDEKQHFKSTVLRGQNNRNLLKEKVKEFALKCRGFHGTMYALETF